MYVITAGKLVDDVDVDENVANNPSCRTPLLSSTFLSRDMDDARTWSNEVLFVCGPDM
jgi:hypothetical protein